jgi:lysine N6-hydroxylase
VRADLPGALFVQNAERHTHGVGAPDLGLVAWRAATILNAVCGRSVYRLPDRTAFTTFGLPGGGG